MSAPEEERQLQTVIKVLAGVPLCVACRKPLPRKRMCLGLHDDCRDDGLHRIENIQPYLDHWE